VQAHRWFTLAVNNGVQKALKHKSSAEARMSPEQIEQAQAFARDELEKQ
jgi:hypothetical protein